MELAGGCLCGAVRYAVRGVPFNATVCHCVDCRRAAGSPMVAWFTVRPGELAFTTGEPHRFVSSPGVERSFCGRCGTPLTFRHEGLDEVDVATCSLDDPGAVPPADHTRFAGKVDWVVTGDALPRYPGVRSPAG